MKLWKTLLIAISVAILPFALVGVGQAQQLTCWGLKPNLPESTEHTNFSEQLSPQKRQDILERTGNTVHHAEDENDTENAELWLTTFNHSVRAKQRALGQISRFLIVYRYNVVC